MENKSHQIAPMSIRLLTVSLLLVLSSLFNCSYQKSAIKVSQYTFDYGGQRYRIRSINTEQVSASYNELIGRSFVARDFDQDGIIDRIIQGDELLVRTQGIYDFGIRQLRMENKLRQRTPAQNHFLVEQDKYRYEIKSFPANGGEQFNEFTIIDLRQKFFPVKSVGVDNDSDGVLEQMLKGPVPLTDAQTLYEKVVQQGLEKGQLEKRNNRITVVQR